jgi:hypothetical protein
MIVSRRRMYIQLAKVQGEKQAVHSVAALQ